MARFNYLELPVADSAESAAFYHRALGITFTTFGPTYAASTTGDTDIGFQADPAQQSAGLLPVIEVDDLDAALASVTAAGGAIVVPIFAFPGGRRFHFTDPDGHELAVAQANA